MTTPHQHHQPQTQEILDEKCGGDLGRYLACIAISRRAILRGFYWSSDCLGCSEAEESSSSSPFSHKNMGNGKRKASENKEAGAGALTATQLRNRRKRRKQKEDKKAAKAQGGGANIAGPLGSGRKKNQDPSQRYISKPTKAPIVRRAVQFFRDKKNSIFI